MGNCCVESKTLEFERNSKKQKVPLSNNTSNPNGQSTAVNLNNQANINSLQLKRLSEQINKNDEITYSHEDFMKGEFKGKGRYGSVYSGLCDVSGEIIAIKILDNVPQEKINEILFSIEKLYSLYHKNRCIIISSEFLLSELQILKEDFILLIYNFEIIEITAVGSHHFIL